ncbi:MAG: ATP-binding protein [Oligoflexia bacterium]|nr:ATP-binding protein [Oligoflexia bacterium]
MAGYINRSLKKKLRQNIKDYPVVALLGPRQVGKSTLAKEIINKHSRGVYLDLEKPSHLNQLNAPEYFFEQNKSFLICLDEVQRYPEIFPLLRSLADERKKNGQFLILGSAGRDLLKQSSESLAGRISYLEMSPFTLLELSAKKRERLWLRGGFPRSFLGRSETASLEWRENYIRTFLERDIPQLGFRIPPTAIGRLWNMLAYSHGQTLNSSKLAGSLGVSSHTVNSYIDILEKTFLIRLLQPFSENLKKRLVKSPKVYIRDSGLLHSLLKVDTMNELFSHPVFGSSFEGFVLEQIISSLPRWQFYFYRTRSGAEIDLLMIKGIRRIAIEIKAGKSPVVEKGFWTAVEDVKAKEKYLIAPVDTAYTIKDNVKVTSLSQFLDQFV